LLALLQVDDDLISALHAAGFEIGVESNGTLAAPDGIDWLCVSPKGSAPVVQTFGQELKLVYPQSEPEAQPENFVGMDFDNFYLQPLDDPHIEQNTHHALEYCLAHPRWKLSIQTHKVLGID
jgi:organic radical activating enzyme